MARIPEETIDQVISSTDIVDLLLNGYGIQLKRAGTSYKACCPFHNEKTPSFNVSADRQRYKCFGCGEGGGVVNFVMNYENLSFVDSIKKLAQRASIPIIEESYDPQVEKIRKRRSKLLELHVKLTDWMHEQLLKAPEAQHARDYLNSRGYDLEMAKRWKIGWIPENSRLLVEWAKQVGFSAKEFVEAGIAAPKDESNPGRGVYFRFRNRLMFPINNDYGDPIAFTARQLVEDANTGKYINSPETALFNKSRTIFGLDKARRPILKQKYVLVCEGQMDVIACVESGFEHAVACSGTSFTAEHAQILKKYTKQVCLCFDGDAAGQKATQRAYAELAKVGLEVQVVSLPTEHDPDTFIKERGQEAFQNELDQRQHYFDYRIRVANELGLLNEPRAKADLVQLLAEELAHISDHVQQDTYALHVADRLNVDRRQLSSKVSENKQKLAKGNLATAKRTAAREEGAAVSSATQESPLNVHAYLEALMGMMLVSSEIQEVVLENSVKVLRLSELFEGGRLLAKLIKRVPFKTEKTEDLSELFASVSESESRCLAKIPRLNKEACSIEALNKILLTMKAEFLHKTKKKKEFMRASEDTEESLKPILKKEILDLERQLNELPRPFRLNFN